MSIHDTQLGNVDQFKYLGSTMVPWTEKPMPRSAKEARRWGDSETECSVNIRLSTKLRIYNVVVLLSLLYGCEF